MALPVIDNLALAHADALIEAWCGPHSSAIFEQHPRISTTIEIPDVPTWRDLPGLISALRGSTNDGFFVLDRSRLIAAACRLAGVPVAGTVRTGSSEPMHEIDRYLCTLQQADIPIQVRTPSLRAGLDVGDAHQQIVRDLDGRYATLHPGGARNPGTAMVTKRWPAGSWRAVIEWLADRSIEVVLTGSPEERDLCSSIAVDTPARVAAGRLSLIESACLASGGIAFAGPDTGLAHLVAATGTPTIAIFGPTNPRQYAPRGDNVTILAPPSSYHVAEIDLRKSGTRTGPSTGYITVEHVFDALETILDRTRIAE